MEIRLHTKENLKGSLLLVGFPSRGLVGGVAATYVMANLKMDHIASVYDPMLPPTMIVRDGLGHSPIQFFSSMETCGPDGSCDRLVVCHSEIPLEPDLLNDAAWSILEFAKAQGISHVVVLEGVEAKKSRGAKAGKNGHGSTPVIRGARSLHSRHKLERYNVEPIEEGIFSGYASSFMMAANDLGMDLLALFVEASGDMPDARAATLLLRSVDAMLPNIDFRTKALEQRARQLEARLKITLEQSKRQMDEVRRTLDMMYR